MHLGHPPLQTAKNKSSSFISVVSPSISYASSSNNLNNDMLPFDSPVSNKVIGYIVTSVIRPVPVWGVLIFLLDEPVR